MQSSLQWGLVFTGLLVGTMCSPALGQNWTLTFDDEFNGTGVDTTKWSYGYPWGNYADPTQELQGYNLSNPGVNNNNVSEGNGVLTLTATHTSIVTHNAVGGATITQPYTSGCLSTDQKFSQLYGRFDISAKLPAGDGLLPAFWLLSTAQTAPELDVFENLGSDPTKLYFTDHYDTQYHYVQGSSTGSTNYSAGFHLYSLVWSPSGITWSVDNNIVYSAAGTYAPSGPMEPIISLAVGSAGSWPGAPDASTTFPASMQVDYVHVYTDSSVPEPGMVGALVLPLIAALRRRRRYWFNRPR